MKIETEEYMTIERREAVKAEARKLRRQFLRYDCLQHATQKDFGAG